MPQESDKMSLNIDPNVVQKAAIKAIKHLSKQYGLVTRAVDGVLDDADGGASSNRQNSDNTVYTYLSERFPLVVDDAIPPAAHQNMVEVGTFACTDKKNVYIDTRLFAEKYPKIVRNAIKTRVEGGCVTSAESQMEDINRHPTKFVEADMATLIGHEYTHILMNHHERGNRFARQSKNAANIATYNLACEIEANRGQMVQSYSMVYNVAVTEQSFPETVGVYGLQNIYEALKRRHGDDIDSEANYHSMKSADEKGKKAKKCCSTQSSCSPNEGKEKQGQTQTAGGDEGKEESGGTPANSLNKAQKRAIENISNELNETGTGVGLSPSEMTDDLSKYADIPSEQDIETSATNDIYRALDKAVLRKTIKQDMARLKGVLAGADISVGREKTYSRQPRKDAETGLMRKGIKRGKAHAPRVLIAMDSSGSMSGTTSTQILAAIMEVMRVVGRSVQGSWICMHDSFVTNMRPLHEYEEVVKQFKGQGGNCFDNVLREAIKKDIEIVINVGDGQDYLWNAKLLRQAKEKGIRWVDVIISKGTSKYDVIHNCEHEVEIIAENATISNDEAREIQMKREILKLN